MTVRCQMDAGAIPAGESTVGGGGEPPLGPLPSGFLPSQE